MGQKIATEEDYWMCSGGLMPIQLQSVQQIAIQKNDKKYLTQGDTYTSPNGDFICRKLMLLAAIIAAIIVVAIVATGGAALGAIVLAGAAAGAAGAAAGAAIGALICGQKVALVRLWGLAKGDLVISNQKAITTGSQMACPIFGDKIVAAPNVKNWWQALAIGLGNFGEEVIMGTMAGALIGLGGATIAGEATIAFPTLTSIGSNIWASITGWGMAARVYFGANNTANKYATGEIDINNQNQRDGAFLEAAFPEYGSIKRILSGAGQPSDALILLYFLHVKTPVKAPAGKPPEPPGGESKPPEPPEGQSKPPEPPAGEGKPPEPPGEEGKKPGEDGKAYEKDPVPKEPPINQKLRELVEADAKELALLDVDERGPVVARAYDAKTGKVSERYINVDEVPSDLHKLLKDRIEFLDKNGKRHYSKPGTHAEVLAVDELLKAREAAGETVTPETLKDITTDQYWLDTKQGMPNDGINPAPTCGNCTDILKGTNSQAGKK